MTDLLFKPQMRLAQRLRHFRPEYIMTVETRGIPLKYSSGYGPTCWTD